MKLIHLIFGVLITASFIYLSIIFWPQDPPPEKKYIIKWCAVEAEVTGQGKTRFLKKEADAIALKLNLEYGGLLIHWAEKVPTRSETCIVGQLFYDTEDVENPQTYICCQPESWKLLEENHEWTEINP